MKKVLIVLLATIMFSTVAFGNGKRLKEKRINNKEMMNFELNDEQGMVGNGGPLLSVLFLDLSELNVKLKSAGFKELEGQKYGNYNVMYAFGGGGIGGTFKNRFGGYGATGRIMSIIGDKKVKLEIGYGGFVYEKGLFLIKSTGTNVSAGFLFGGGNATLTLIYDDIKNEFGEVIAAPHSNILTKEYLMFAPRLNIHQRIGSFISLDLSAEYMMNLDLQGKWQLDDEEIDGPLSNSQSPVFGARLSFGI
ncbi:hypothetical protein [Haliovirga abyssi]|uniref:DUF481 domain-containing protein n=1 Tax=Haliovirga abyssi TaxID=2996794 RepID=A0AAU9DD88_9FUSO|nr:hypothetical protein [Haliovirga abyssi]BDU51310.1 hypothetical protein HLVA_18790 [Haliovirga abyssi]